MLPAVFTPRIKKIEEKLNEAMLQPCYGEVNFWRSGPRTGRMSETGLRDRSRISRRALQIMKGPGLTRLPRVLITAFHFGVALSLPFSAALFWVCGFAFACRTQSSCSSHAAL